jgi:DNA mismatch repair protein MutH
MMTFLLAKNPPRTEQALLELCGSLEGFTFSQLALGLGILCPENPLQRKGWLGQALELALGATAKSHAKPDFCALGIELKTIPIHWNLKPAESTFITSIPLLSIHQQQWETSTCFAKLKRVLWIPVEGAREIPYRERRIGLGFLWSPSLLEEAILKEDWNHLTTLIATGQLETLDARSGEYLQVRPKALDANALCYGYDAEGNKIKTLPRGFYLRSRFTAQILESSGLK